MDATTSADFYKFMTDRGYTDSNAREIIARHNTFKDTKSDRAIMREYLNSRERSGGADREDGTPDQIKTDHEGRQETMEDTGRRIWTEEDGAEYKEELKTSGRKGLKLDRINMAFTPSNHEYITTMARVRGQTLTQFVNDIIAKSKEDNAELYKQALAFRDRFK